MQVDDAFQRIGGFGDFKFLDIKSADPIYYYRNKMEFTFSPHRWVLDSEPEGVDSSFALGLHIPGRFDKILDIDDCHIQPEIGNKILSVAREVCLENLDLKPYDPRTNVGFLRHLMLRFGVNTDQLMVNIVTAYDDINKLSPLIDRLLDEIPEITSMVNNVNTRKADVAYGEFENLIFGNNYIEETIGDLKFEISANSFFQTNTYQGKTLYDEVVNAASLKGDEVVYDLYCGTGSIALYLAKKVKVVYGFEVIRSSLENAERNAIINNMDNVHFLKANLDTFFQNGTITKKGSKAECGSC
jgi:23S rRNA (uracil-5-)-methyltransferase RumA